MTFSIIVIVIAVAIYIWNVIPRHCVNKLWPYDKHFGHMYQHHYGWNAWMRSKWSGDYISRSGKRCGQCGDMIWDQTDEEFLESIKDVVDYDDKNTRQVWFGLGGDVL